MLGASEQQLECIVNRGVDTDSHERFVVMGIGESTVFYRIVCKYEVGKVLWLYRRRRTTVAYPSSGTQAEVREMISELTEIDPSKSITRDKVIEAASLLSRTKCEQQKAATTLAM